MLLGAGGVYAALAPHSQELVNVAFKKQVTPSLSIDSNPAALAIDGDPNTFWNSGPAPQWLEIDLGKTYQVEAIELLIEQTPKGVTQHEILGADNRDGSWITLATFKGETGNHQRLRTTWDQPRRNVRYLKIQTLQSPSSVAWAEIEVFSRGQ
jgi:hypothetical protein